MNYNHERNQRRLAHAQFLLCARGWTQVHEWRFRNPSGQVFDMSATDLQQFGGAGA